MAIKRKTTATAAAVEKFIGAAPDAGGVGVKKSATYEKGIAKGNKRQISLTIAPELLRKVDEVAAKTGQGRAAIINLSIYRALEGNVFAG